MERRHFDYLVIGGGPAGYEAAALAAERGFSTALVERDHLGGTCLNRGCIPTKCLCASAQAADAIARSGNFGLVMPEGVKPVADLSAMVARKNAVVGSLREGVRGLLGNVEVIKGEARFVEPKAVETADGIVEADKVVIATGSEAASLDIPGASLCVDSTALLDLDTLPASLAVIGGGVIGMEFASIFASFGVKVAVVEYAREILPQFDRDVAKRLRTTMKQRGVEFFTSAAVEAVEEPAHGMRRVCFTRNGKPGAVEAEVVLMAVGRRPVIPEGAAEAGYEIDRKGFKVRHDLLTNIPGVWAVGDCNGLCQLAHAASAQARSVMGERVDLSVVPAAVFTHPECAMVGITSEQADDPERYAEGKAFFRANGKACAMDETDGIVKVILDSQSGLIAGVHVCGPHASDLIAEAALAMSARLQASELIAAVHAHPTLSEALAAAVEQAILKL